MSQTKVAIIAVGALIVGFASLSLLGGSKPKSSGGVGSSASTARPSKAHPLQSRFDAARPAPTPDLPEFSPLTPGVKFAKLRLGGDGPGGNTELYILLPDKPAAPPSSPASLPCVFVAPAGSNGITGMDLADGDLDECVPYVLAGFAAIAYSLDGETGEDSSPRFKDDLAKFRDAAGGAVNTRAAIDYALARIPEIDPKRLYGAGHSSAGAATLTAAMLEPRLRAVAAYAPCTDYIDAQGRVYRFLERSVPGLTEFAREVSVLNYADHIRIPTLLFTAKDDDLLNVHESTLALHTAMSKLGLKSSLVVVPTGGHYDSMIDKGIPAGIQFFTDNGAFPPPPRRTTTKPAPTTKSSPTTKPVAR